MLYIAKESSKTQPSTIAFKERGIPLTQTRVSDITILGRARSVQLAYSGYKDNIEAFLLATASGKKVTTNGSVYTIPDDYVPTVPLEFPQTILKLAKAPSAANLKLMMDKLEAQGIARVEVGRGEPAFTLSRPTFKSLTQTFPGISHPQTAFIDHHAQLEASMMSCRLYQCVDLFLRTNTYYYKEGDYVDKVTVPARVSGIAKNMEARVDAWWNRPGVPEGTDAHKRRKGDDGKEILEDIDDEEPTDLTPDRIGHIMLQDVVFVAKPSPLPSSTNYGPPSSVPNVPGLLFPYFKGLLVPDAAGLRVLSSRFLRNFGDNKNTPKDGFVQFRKVIGTFANTPQGVMMTHILLGVQLALECQAVLFLLIDAGKYMGFVILGTEFDIFLQGRWWAPYTREQLRGLLNQMRTHEQSLGDLAEVLKKCVLVDGDIPEIPTGGLRTCNQIADILAQLDLDADGHTEDEAEIKGVLSRITFPSPPLTFKPTNIAQSIKYLTGQAVFPEDSVFFIPLQDWSGLRSKEYRILAQYGPRSFSLRNTKGDELLIRKDAKDRNIFDEKDDKDKIRYQKYIVGEKVLNQCVNDWRSLVETRSMRMDFMERAAGSRNHTFTREIFRPVWEALTSAVDEGLIGTKPIKDTNNKRDYATAFASVEFSADLFD